MRVTEVFAATDDLDGRRALARWIKARGRGANGDPIGIAEILPPEPEDAADDQGPGQQIEQLPAAFRPDTVSALGPSVGERRSRRRPVPGDRLRWQAAVEDKTRERMPALVVTC